VELIPSVIGVRTDDIRLDVRLALRSARAALPIAAAPRQTVMAVSILSAERVLAEVEGRSRDDLSRASRDVLAEVPHASAAAQRLASNAGISVRGFRRHAAPNTVRSAVRAIAQACIPDHDERLRRLLTEAIEDSAPWRVETPLPVLPVTTGGASASPRR
jgi:hypothetical protein